MGMMEDIHSPEAWVDLPEMEEDDLAYHSAASADKSRMLPYDRLHKWDYKAYLRSAHWDIVRRRALLRAGNQCKGCESTHILDVHHLSYKRLWREKESDVIVLCRDCHALIHNLPRVGWSQDLIDRLVRDSPHLIRVVRDL